MNEWTATEKAAVINMLSRTAAALEQLNETNAAIATELMLLRKGDHE